MALPSIEQYIAVGRRKTATARVYLRPGRGKIVVNRQQPVEGLCIGPVGHQIAAHAAQLADLIRISSGWASGSPSRQLNSSTRGPFAVSISPA